MNREKCPTSKIRKIIGIRILSRKMELVLINRCRIHFREADLSEVSIPPRIRTSPGSFVDCHASTTPAGHAMTFEGIQTSGKDEI